MSLNEKFNVAADKVRKFSKKPDEKDLLELYSLYKQSMFGDCNIGRDNAKLLAKPSDGEAKAKWEAWNSRKGMTQDSAKSVYITRANALLPKYA